MSKEPTAEQQQLPLLQTAIPIYEQRDEMVEIIQCPECGFAGDADNEFDSCQFDDWSETVFCPQCHVELVSPFR